MSRKVTMDIDGSQITMITDETEEHIDRVMALIHDALSLIKRKNGSINSASNYRYVMVYLADQVIDLQDIVAGKQPLEGATDDEVLQLKKDLQALRSQQVNWEGRVSQLQELLLEKNQLIQELKENR
ncbi:hypothetical protein [Guggenheimella bovis]